MRLSLLLAGLLLALGCNRPSGYDSPEDAFMAEQTARRDSDFGLAYDTLTPQSQKFAIGMILSIVAGNVAQKAPDKNAHEQLRKWHAHLQETVDLAQRYGVDVNGLPQEVPLFDVEGCLDLAKRFPVREPRRFYAEYWQMFTVEMEASTQKKLWTGDFIITDVEYDDSFAYAIKRRENDTTQVPLAFQRINGKWFVDDIAKLNRWQSPESKESD